MIQPRIPNAEAKMLYLRARQLNRCAIGQDYGHIANCEELHHKLHNTEPNRRRYPLLIHSLMNLVGVSRYWHTMHPYWGRPTLLDADKMEAFLRRHPQIAEKLNDPRTGEYT